MEKTFSLLLIVYLFCIISISYAETEQKEPQYMKVFSQHQQWEGYYMYEGKQQYCLFFIHSEHYAKKDGLLATLKDKLGTTIEMEGESLGTSNLQVSFTEHVIFEDSSRFPENFSFTGALYQEQDVWKYKGSVTVPQYGLFGEIFLTQSSGHLSPLEDDEDRSWRYVVIIGIPIILALVGIAGTVGMVYWALKKGYIRHVPKTYDNFRNPSVKYETDKEAVHI